MERRGQIPESFYIVTRLKLRLPPRFLSWVSEFTTRPLTGIECRLRGRLGVTPTTGKKGWGREGEIMMWSWVEFKMPEDFLLADE